MAFAPLYGNISIEKCDVSADWTKDDEILVDGTVRLAPDITWVPPDRWGLDSADWDYDNIYLSAADLLTDWTKEANTYVDYFAENDGWVAMDFKDWPQGYVTVVGREQTTYGHFGTGETHYIETEADGWENVDNAAGWTAEFTFFIPQDVDQNTNHRNHPSFWLYAAQGGAWYVDFDDGTKKGRIWIDPFSCLFVPSEHDKKKRELWLGESPTGAAPAYSLYKTYYWTSFKLYPRTIRITVKGDEIWITTNTGITGTTQPTYQEVAYDYAYTNPVDPNDRAYTTEGSIGATIGLVVESAISASNNFGLFTGTIYSYGNGSFGAVGVPPSSTGYPTPGTPTGLPNGSVYGPNGAIGFYYNSGGQSRFSEVPPSQRDPQDPPTQKHTIHLTNAGLAASGGTKKFGFYHSALGEAVAGFGCRASVLLLDNFRVAVNENHEGLNKIEFSGDHTSYSPALQPELPVDAWGNVIYTVERGVPSGQCFITPQYYDGGWNDHGSPVEVVNGQNLVDLSGIATTQDGEDKVRFKVRHVAADGGTIDGSDEPPRVDEIQVTWTPVSADFDITPNFGPSGGGNYVTLEWQNASGDFAPGQQVFVGDTEVAAGSITHVDSETKIIQMPAKDPGEYFIKVIGSTYWSVRPYTYVASYDIEADGGGGGLVVPTGDLEAVFGNTRSPFRVLNRMPGHGVNLALVGATQMDQDIHMAMVNLSDREPSNLTGFGAREETLYNGTSGDFYFEDAVDTKDVLVSNRSAMWRGQANPRPLFYKYLVGRDRYYVHAPTATGEGDLDTIRQSINVYQEGGIATNVAWDISATTGDYNGEALPQDFYAVVLYTDFIPKETLWVSYRGGDRLDGYASPGTKRETINPVPLFDTKAGRMNAQVVMTPVGKYNVNVEV